MRDVFKFCANIKMTWKIGICPITSLSLSYKYQITDNVSLLFVIRVHGTIVNCYTCASALIDRLRLISELVNMRGLDLMTLQLELNLYRTSMHTEAH